MGSINHFWKSFAAQVGLSLISSLIKPIWIWTENSGTSCFQSVWLSPHGKTFTHTWGQTVKTSEEVGETLTLWGLSWNKKIEGYRRYQAIIVTSHISFCCKKKIYHVWPSNDLKNKTWCQEYRQITGKLNSLSFGIQIWESVCEKTYKYRINSSPCHEPWTPHH